MRKFAIIVALCLTGCGSEFRNAEPIERGLNRGFDIAEKLADKGISELSAHSTNANVAGAVIEPGYEGRGYAGIFNGVMWHGEAFAKGTSATGTLASQAGPPNKNVETFGATKEDPQTDPTKE